MDDVELNGDFLVLAISVALVVVGIVLIMPVFHYGTLSPHSPETAIDRYEIVGAGRSRRTYLIIEVEGHDYRCMGESYAVVGTPVLYDPADPRRCRQPSNLWVLVGSERLGGACILGGLGGIFYGVIAMLFLRGTPVQERRRLP